MAMGVSGNHKGHNERKGFRKRKGFTFGITPKVTKGLGPEPPKAEKPGGIPKIRKLATLKQYGFLNGIPPGFSPADRFFRQRPRGYGSYKELVTYTANHTIFFPNNQYYQIESAQWCLILQCPNTFPNS